MEENLNGTILTTREYDLADRPVSISHMSGMNKVISEFEYGYSAVGNITQWTQRSDSGEKVLSLTYDKLDRLTQTSAGEAFDYDILGNRQNYNSSYNLINQLIEDQEFSFTYSANGNLDTKTNKYTGESLKYYWDSNNRLILLDKRNEAQEIITSITYRYDSLGRRIERAVVFANEPERNYTRKFIYDNEDIIMELDGEDNPVAVYMHGPGIDNPLAMIRDVNGDGEFAADEVFYYTKDHLGSVRELVNFEGKIIQRYSYSAYGKTTIEDHDQSPYNKLVENRYAYTSREIEEETGDYFYRARYYDPAVGRFLSEDPIGFGGRDYNLYRYVGSSPVQFNDPSGLQSFGNSNECLKSALDNYWSNVGSGTDLNVCEAKLKNETQQCNLRTMDPGDIEVEDIPEPLDEEDEEKIINDTLDSVFEQLKRDGVI